MGDVGRGKIKAEDLSAAFESETCFESKEVNFCGSSNLDVIILARDRATLNVNAGQTTRIEFRYMFKVTYNDICSRSSNSSPWNLSKYLLPIPEREPFDGIEHYFLQSHFSGEISTPTKKELTWNEGRDTMRMLFSVGRRINNHNLSIHF